MLEFGEFTRVDKEVLERQEELEKIIAEAKEELFAIQDREMAAELQDEIENDIKGADDYEYWKGKSEHLIDIDNAERLPINAKKSSRMYLIKLSYCEMERSYERNIMIVRHWKNEPVKEKGVVTHFQKVNFIEKKYQQVPDQEKPGKMKWVEIND